MEPFRFFLEYLKPPLNLFLFLSSNWGIITIWMVWNYGYKTVENEY